MPVYKRTISLDLYSLGSLAASGKQLFHTTTGRILRQGFSLKAFKRLEVLDRRHQIYRRTMLLTTFKTSFPCVPWALVIVVATVMAGAFADNDEGLLQSVQIEYFKANLLKKLGLVAAPRITRPSVPPPEPLVRKVETENRLRAWEVARTSDDAGDMDDEFVGQHQEHILFPKVAPCAHRPHQLCFHFDLTKYQRHDVTKAEVWMHLPGAQGNETLILTELPFTSGIGFVHQYSLRPNPQQWVQVDIKQSVRRWIKDGKSKPEMAIVCNLRETEHPTSCIGDLRWETRPFLLLKANPVEFKKRRKRSVTPRCVHDPKYCCKRRDLTISFANLGWNFIVSPANLTTGFCWGECSTLGIPATEGNRTSLHASFMQRLGSTADTWYLQPCCTPTQYSSVSILYTNTRGEYLYDEVNIVVRSCGCR